MTDDPISCLQKLSENTVTLLNDLRSCQKDELISKLTVTEGLTGLGEKRTQEKVMK
jgi:hypothetical protein